MYQHFKTKDKAKRHNKKLKRIKSKRIKVCFEICLKTDNCVTGLDHVWGMASVSGGWQEAVGLWT